MIHLFYHTVHRKGKPPLRREMTQWGEQPERVEGDEKYALN